MIVRVAVCFNQFSGIPAPAIVPAPLTVMITAPVASPAVVRSPAAVVVRRRSAFVAQVEQDFLSMIGTTGTGVAGVYYHATGESSPVSGLLYDSDALVTMVDDTQLQAARLTYLIGARSLSRSPGPGDKLVIGGMRFSIERHKAGQYGSMMLYLSRV